MPSDNDSYQPSSSGSDGSSDERELQTLDELQKKVIADGEEESSGETESSGPDDKSHSDSSSEKAPPPRKTKAVNKTPKKNTPRRQSSSLDRGSGGKKRTTKKKVVEESRESSEDDSSSSSRLPKTPRKRKPQKQAGKKKRKKKATSVNTTGKGKKAGSTTFTPDELLLLSKAYMKVSCNAKHGTDKKAEKFWDDIALRYVELVGKANHINEDNIDYSNIDIMRNAESLRNCWQRRLQPAVQKFCGILATNPPQSGEVKDDAIMDRYYSRMRMMYSEMSHSFKRDVPKDFSKCMKAYMFLSSHPKFDVEIPLNPSQKRPSKNPNAIQAEADDFTAAVDIEDSQPDNSFVIHPPRLSRPVGRELAKRADAVNFIVDEVSKRATDNLKSPSLDTDAMMGVLQRTLSQANEHMSSIAHQQAAMANHQVMMSAPTVIRESYFGDIYATIQLKTANRRMQEEVRQLELAAKKKELEDQLSRKNNNADSDDEPVHDKTRTDDGSDKEDDPDDSYNIQNQSPWVKLALSREEVNASDLANCQNGTEFACLHNRDSHDFMNESKFHRFILKRTNSNEPPRWDLLHETAAVVVDHIVEDEDQGPSKEWGPYGWYCHPTKQQIEAACIGKSVRKSV